MKVMNKNGITRHVSDATAERLKAFGYVEVKNEEPKQEKSKKSAAANKDGE